MDKVENLVKKAMPVADLVVTIAAVVIWVVTHNFTWGMLLWLLGEAFRIQINQYKIMDKLDQRT